MSIILLREILHSKSKIVWDKNAARIHVNIITQAGHHIVFNYFVITEIENIKQEEVLKCVICYYICDFTIVFPCGHVICSCFYVRHFKLNHYQRFNSYYTKCPHCMEFINFSDSLTITQEIEVHPNSILSLFYQNALIQSPNDWCNQKISLSNWFKHINSTCDYSLVQCPAIECNVTGTPNDVFTNFIQCPFHTVWCYGCKIN